MKKIAILAASLAASAAAQQPAAPSASANANAADPNERICLNLTRIGSRLAHQRRCMTRAEWVEFQQTQSDMISEAQMRQINPGDMNPGVRASANGRYLPGAARGVTRQ